MTTTDRQALSRSCDVVIVGGGVAGFYTAWRLLQENPDQSITVLESSQRLGGRLYSEKAPGFSSVCVEHGGMRYSRQHQLLSALVGYLKLPTAPYSSVLDGFNPIFLRGSRTSLKGLESGDDVPFLLPSYLKSHQPGSVIPEAVMAFLAKRNLEIGKDMSLLDILKSVDFDGRDFEDISFLDFLALICEDEMFEYYNSVHGYWVDTHKNVSAYELLSGFLPFVSDAETITLRDGMQALPCTLASLAIELGCQVEQGSSVRQITAEGDSLTVSGTRDQTSFMLRASRVVLTLPPNRLRELEGLEALAPALHASLSKVIEIPAIKTHFSYSTAWWSSMGIVGGEARTDLPLRQCLYMGSDAQREGKSTAAAPDAGPAMLLACYTDSDASDFWRRQPDAQSDPDDLAGPADPALRCGRSHRLKLMEQLSRLHGRELPAPIWSSSCDWTKQPSGVATHIWRVGANSAKTLPLIRHPNPSLPLYVCGEAFSQEQGWVNGALRSAEALLRGPFGLARPSWCPAGAPVDTL